MKARFIRPGWRPQARLRWILLLVMAAAMGVFYGCGFLKPIDGPFRANRSSQGKPIIAPVYRHFDDILVPKVMQVTPKTTWVSETAAMTAGVVSLEGTPGRRELIRFFETNMARDNWRVVSKLAGPRTIFQFEKQNRWCILTITERSGIHGTQVEIWVIPKDDAAATGLLK